MENTMLSTFFYNIEQQIVSPEYKDIPRLAFFGRTGGYSVNLEIQLC